MEYKFWYDGWATGKSTFPMPDATNIETLEFEAESVDRGAAWELLEDGDASGGKYVTIRPGLNSPQAIPAGKDGALQVPFTVTRDAKYYVFARVSCATADDDSFWVKLDDGRFTQANGLRTTGWEWVKVTATALKPGEHTLTIAYREDGALLDKICITSYAFGPTGLEGIEGKGKAGKE